jgi:hypothetical protein
MGEFTQAAHSAPHIPGIENWRGLRVGQEWTRITRQHLNWPLGRVTITDLIIRNQTSMIVKFIDAGLEPGRDRLELGIDSFLKEFKQ